MFKYEQPPCGYNDIIEDDDNQRRKIRLFGLPFSLLHLQKVLFAVDFPLFCFSANKDFEFPSEDKAMAGERGGGEVGEVLTSFYTLLRLQRTKKSGSK